MHRNASLRIALSISIFNQYLSVVIKVQLFQNKEIKEKTTRLRQNATKYQKALLMTKKIAN